MSNVVSVCVCLDVNQAGTKSQPLRTETCNLAFTDVRTNPDRTPKADQCDLYFKGQNHRRRKVAVNRHVAASRASQPMGLLVVLVLLVF